MTQNTKNKKTKIGEIGEIDKNGEFMKKYLQVFFKHFHEYPNEKLRYIDIRLFNFIAFGMINLQYAKKCICIIESQ